MTGESAKDTADKVNDVKEQLNDLAKSEALDKLKYKFDQIEQGITKIDTALSLLNSMSDLTYYILQQKKHIFRCTQNVATWKGLEPSTSGVTGQRSNQLSYQATYI